MRLLISTTLRRVTSNEKSGHLYTFDLDQQRILKRSTIIEPPYRDADTNPRGGMRGCKGIAIRPDLIAISNTSTIFLYDNKWNPLRVISHPSCAGIHEILFHQDHIFVTAARTDMIFSFDLAGNLIDYLDFREPPLLRRELRWYPPITQTKQQIWSGVLNFRDPRSHEFELYDHAHVNSICSLENGDLLVSLGLVLDMGFVRLLLVKKWLKKMNFWSTLIGINRLGRQLFRRPKTMHSELLFQPAKGRSVVVRVTNKKEIRVLFVLEDKIVPSHSVHPISENQVVYLDTTNGSVVEFDPDTGGVLNLTKVTDGFLRGVTSIFNNRLVLGSVGEIILFDLKDRVVYDRIQLTDSPQESIFDIQVLPDHYQLPPNSFDEIDFIAHKSKEDSN